MPRATYFHLPARKVQHRPERTHIARKDRRVNGADVVVLGIASARKVANWTVGYEASVYTRFNAGAPPREYPRKSPPTPPSRTSNDRKVCLPLPNVEATLSREVKECVRSRVRKAPANVSGRETKSKGRV